MNSDHYISLIYKELKGEISSEEATDLREWEAQSSENQTTAEEIRQVWVETEEYELPFELDHDMDFAKVKTTIATSNSPSKIIPIKPRRLWIRTIAAAVIVLLGATFLFQNYFQSETEWKTIAASSDIQEIQLSDGSKVWLNAGSTLSYPAKFSKNERPIKLEGEAFFEVSKDANRPFQVRSNQSTVTVLGTKFNVRDFDKGTFEVAVEEGKVQVQKNETSQKVILIKNEKAVYDESKNSLEKVNDKNLNTIAWKRQSFKFQDTPLEKVLSDITDLSGMPIMLGNEKMKKCPISGRFSTKTEIINLLKNIADLHNMKVIQISDHAYQLNGGNCK